MSLAARDISINYLYDKRKYYGVKAETEDAECFKMNNECSFIVCRYLNRKKKYYGVKDE